MFVIIMGCGRVGAALANLLEQDGHEITVLDVNPDAFGRLGPNFKGTTAIGNGIDVETLRRVGIERAQAFAACTQGDNRNIMASQIAHVVFGVPKVVTRIYDPMRKDTFRALGLDAISPTTIGAAHFYEHLTGQRGNAELYD
jgi:trk system potassium uptake protein TrkA